MNLRRFLVSAAACALIVLTGCATKPQLPVPMSQAALSTPGTRVGVAMTALPKVDTFFPGADCLLCLAAASVANSTLTSYTQALGYEDLPKLKEMAAELLRKRGLEVTVIAENIRLEAFADKAVVEGVNQARKDFSPLRKQHGIDKLLLIDLRTIGFQRTYAAYFPTSDPKATLVGSAALIDLKTLALDWYRPVSVLRASDGAWDEPPKFPGLSNAYFQMIELGKDQVLKPFMP